LPFRAFRRTLQEASWAAFKPPVPAEVTPAAKSPPTVFYGRSTGASAVL
jgi:hypothetical protein